jgi:hypothetical protein
MIGQELQEKQIELKWQRELIMYLKNMNIYILF